MRELCLYLPGSDIDLPDSFALRPYQTDCPIDSKRLNGVPSAETTGNQAGDGLT